MQTFEFNFYTLSQRLIAARRYRDAMQLASEHLASYPDSRAGHVCLASVFETLEDWPAAERHYREALTSLPDSPDGLAMLAKVVSMQRRYCDAVEIAKSAIAVAPEHAFSHYILAVAQIGLGDADAALQSAQQALALAPDSSDYQHLVVLLGKNNNRTVVQSRIKLGRLLAALGNDPQNAPLLHSLGQTYLELEDLARAEESFRGALTLDPSDESLQQELFRVRARRDVVYRTLDQPVIVAKLLSQVLFSRRLWRWEWSNFGVLLLIAVGGAWAFPAALLTYPARWLYAELAMADVLRLQRKSRWSIALSRSIARAPLFGWQFAGALLVLALWFGGGWLLGVPNVIVVTVLQLLIGPCAVYVALRREKIQQQAASLDTPIDVEPSNSQSVTS